MVGKSTAQVATTAERVPGTVPRVEVFRALGDPTRLAVLDVLAADGARCHCDLVEELDVAANRLSFHLKVLKRAGLVASERRGQRVSYYLRDGALDAVRAAVPSLTDLDHLSARCSACDTTTEVTR